jgi:hypothetical protein
MTNNHGLLFVAIAIQILVAAEHINIQTKFSTGILCI